MIALLLGLGSLTFLGFGIAFLIDPVPLLSALGDAPTAPELLTDIRAMYGGLEVALGTAIGVCALRPELHVKGLWLTGLALAGLVMGRVAGLMAAGFDQPKNLMFGGAELLGLALIVWALRRARRA